MLLVCNHYLSAVFSASSFILYEPIWKVVNDSYIENDDLCCMDFQSKIKLFFVTFVSYKSLLRRNVNQASDKPLMYKFATCAF